MRHGRTSTYHCRHSLSSGVWAFSLRPSTDWTRPIDSVEGHVLVQCLRLPEIQTVVPISPSLGLQLAVCLELAASHLNSLIP